MFRTLRADEIELRVNTCNEKGFSVLLYKDARCDMNILDETVGAMNWKRSHLRDNANCIVSIWDKEKKEWVSKEDTGTESYTEKEKGLASDSFKRACVNWGIGRELYTSPFIWIKGHTEQKNGKYVPKDYYDRDLRITRIEYDKSRCISCLVIKDASNKAVISYGTEYPKEEKTSTKEEQTRPELMDKIEALMDAKGVPKEEVLKMGGVSHLAELEDARLIKLVKWLEKQ